MDAGISKSGADVPYQWSHFDLNDPATHDTLASLAPEDVVGGLTQPETRPRCDPMHDGILLILRGINLNPGADAEDMVSIRLFVTRTQILSVWARPVFAIKRMTARQQDTPPPTTVDWINDLAIDLITTIEGVSLKLDDDAAAAEESMLEGHTPDTPITQKRIQIVKLRRFIGPMRDALTRLAGLDLPWLDPVRLSLRETANRSLRCVEELDAAKDRLVAVQDHFDLQSAERLGRNSYILSVIAAIFLPLGFLTGLFGVNVAGMPGTQWAPAFLALCVGSAIMGVALWAWLRWMKWL